MARKVFAYRHSQEINGQRTHTEEVEIVASREEAGKMAYIVLTQDGVECTAIYNPFTGAFYADDVYGVIRSEAKTRGDVAM